MSYNCLAGAMLFGGFRELEKIDQPAERFCPWHLKELAESFLTCCASGLCLKLLNIDSSSTRYEISLV